MSKFGGVVGIWHVSEGLPYRTLFLRSWTGFITHSQTAAYYITYGSWIRYRALIHALESTLWWFRARVFNHNLLHGVHQCNVGSSELYLNLTWIFWGRGVYSALQCRLRPWASSWAFGCSAQEKDCAEVTSTRVFRLQSAGYSRHASGRDPLRRSGASGL